jgi:predicted fused transcriptional regulator/phosphomethylpyrimidine kinase/predicted transcriptional regulator
MLYPEELFIKDILPNFRIVLAKKLIEKGYSQSKIAKLIGVTQARVNTYAKADLKKTLDKIEEIGFNIEEFNSLIDSIVNEQSLDAIFILRNLRNYFLSSLTSGLLCKYHIKVANLSPYCDVCLKYKEVSSLTERLKMMQEIKKAVENLVSSKEFFFLIPEVYTNLAYSLPNPQGINDVLSFPGRIIKFKNAVKIISEPEFGASKHIANMLIEANKKNQEIRACICIKYDENILRIIKSLKYSFAFNYKKKKIYQDPVVEAFKEFLKNNPVPQILIDKGGKGLEPVCYIFGRNPSEVVSIALSISKSYFERVIVAI